MVVQANLSESVTDYLSVFFFLQRFFFTNLGMAAIMNKKGRVAKAEKGRSCC